MSVLAMHTGESPPLLPLSRPPVVEMISELPDLYLLLGKLSGNMGLQFVTLHISANIYPSGRGHFAVKYADISCCGEYRQIDEVDEVSIDGET
jgi:hypothetical protein